MNFFTTLSVDKEILSAFIACYLILHSLAFFCKFTEKVSDNEIFRLQKKSKWVVHRLKRLFSLFAGDYSLKSSSPSTQIGLSEWCPSSSVGEETESPIKRMGRCLYSVEWSSCFARGRMSSLVRKGLFCEMLRVICVVASHFIFNVSVCPRSGRAPIVPRVLKQCDTDWWWFSTRCECLPKRFVRSPPTCVLFPQ